MRTLEPPTDRQALSAQKMADEGEVLRKYEEEKLIQEMRTLIERKGLKVDLIGKDDAKLSEPVLASGCSGCTLCPCMICW